MALTPATLIAEVTGQIPEWVVPAGTVTKLHDCAKAGDLRTAGRSWSP